MKNSRQIAPNCVTITAMRIASFFTAALLLAVSALSADELADYTKLMKAGAAANGAVRKAIGEKDATTAAAKAKEMAAAFEGMAAFFKAKGKEDGVKFAETAAAAAKAAAAATSPEDMTAALAPAGATCRGCHTVYRDGDKFKGL